MRPRNIPESEIAFAGKTGFLSKSIWMEFFAEGQERWRRESWNLLQARGFFLPHRSSRANDILIPNRSNVSVRALIGDDVPLAPYVGQLDHDEILATSLLRLQQSQVIATFQTEAELKKAVVISMQRKNPDEREKYPDAIVQLVGGLNIALELELTLKSRRRYRNILRTYRTRQDTSRIVFIVRSSAIFDSIRQAMLDTSYPALERPIGFVWLEDWKKDPVNAAIDFKSMNTSMIKMAD